VYVELHAASAFSFLRASSLPEQLVMRAAELGYSALALLDRDGLSGAPRFFQAARKTGVRPIFGAELSSKAGAPCRSCRVPGRATATSAASSPT